MAADVNFSTVQIRSQDIPQVNKLPVPKFHFEYFACATQVKLQCDEMASIKILFVIRELVFKTIYVC